jgi:hypothetical protein
MPPLTLILNPPEILPGLPGEKLQLAVVVQNLGDQSAIIDLFLQADSNILKWCRSTHQRLGLGIQQNGEVIFEFALPSNALPGSFDYTVVVDAPNHYPNDTPIQAEHRLQVLSKEQTVVGNHDPTFFLKPATNSQQPARLKPGEILPFEVQVENHSTQTDQFRLVNEDAEEDWLTIRYPGLDKNAPGRIQEEACLNLNPGERGTIRLEVHPPIHTLAGLYSPALRLHSTNQPDLKRLDFIYIDIETIDTCSIELETILNRVSYRSGEYQIRLANHGNLFRQLSFSASSREEEEWLTYDFQPDQMRLPPNREAQVQLRVTPFRKRRRPWFRGRTFPFQVNLQDAQGYRLTDQQLQAALTWQARPWWQLALGILLALSLLSGTGFLIWWLFLKPPAPIIVEEFKSNSLEYTEGDSVSLNWRIRNPSRIQSLTLTAQAKDPAPDAKPIQPKTFDTKSAPDLPDTCPEPELLCQQYEIGKLAAGRYEFDLQPSIRSGKSSDQDKSVAKLSVAVAAKPDPQVTRFESTQAEYQSGESVTLNWTIGNVSQLAALTVTATNQTNNRTSQIKYSFSQGLPKALQSVCQRKGETLSCSQVPMPGLRAGAYIFGLQATTVKGKLIQSAPTPTISLKPQPLKIVSFVVNGRTSGGNVKLQLNQSLQISWQVTGGEGAIKVNISPYGSLPASGSQDFGKFATAGDHQIQITATDAIGQEVSGAGFLVTVVAPPSPTLRSPTPLRR